VSLSSSELVNLLCDFINVFSLEIDLDLFSVLVFDNSSESVVIADKERLDLSLIKLHPPPHEFTSVERSRLGDSL
jgi:hypothetical protein